LLTADVVVRDGAATSYPSLVTIPNGSQVTVEYSTPGESVNGPFGPDNHWDRVTYNGTTGYASDEYVDTKQAIDSTIPPCSSLPDPPGNGPGADPTCPTGHQTRDSSGKCVVIHGA
jgi:uncharacterized protein YraI